MLQTNGLPTELNCVFLDVFSKWIQHENKPGKILYHYTSLTSLMGMVESRKIWMSKADFLNDSSEMVYFTEIVRKTIAEMVTEDLEESWHRYLADFENCLNRFLNEIHEDGLEVYVFSLSHNKDSLALWYNYSQGDGYNIGFKTEDLLQKSAGIMASHNVIHGYVLYSKEDQEAFLREALLAAYKFVQKQEKEESDTALTKYFTVLLTACSVFIKNPAFNSEEEYRLVAITGREDSKAVEFRARQGVIIPFITVDFGESLPIAHVSIGPKNNIDVAKKGIDYYLKLKGYDLTRVSVSKSFAALRF